ncbi:MAG: hypothetical protein IEMM0008_1817 [bacterium]|nr:MAG: hypothetical protein IEMM0008_1817 [bacterium]
MSLGQEEISLKVLRLLYQYQKQQPDSGLDEQTLVERFDFIDHNEGSTLVRKAIGKLIQIGFVSESVIGQKKIYIITDKGTRHYSKFKIITEEDMSSFPGVMVLGDWQGDSHHNHHHNYFNRAGTINFPGDTEEFIAHYAELLKAIEQIEEKAMDIKGAEGILDSLTEMKALINQDSSALGGKINKLEELISQLKIKIEKDVR